MGRRYRKARRIDAVVRKEHQAIEVVSAGHPHQCHVQSRGFYELYSIDVKRPNHDAHSDRGKQGGLNSPHGRRGAICAHFGWTYDYLMHGIPWAVVERMMIDAPSYDMDSKDEEIIQLTTENGEDIMNYVNSMI